MKCTESGIGLGKDELAALLAHAHKGKKNGKNDEEHYHLARVHFVIEGDRCFAYVTDGHRALEADGESDGAHAGGEWQVDRHFLDEALRLLANQQILRLMFSHASLTEARIEDEVGEEKSTFAWPRDAASAQRSFPQIRDKVQLPVHESRARCVTLDNEYLADLKKVAKAAGRSGVDVYPPVNPLAPIYFRVEGDDGATRWTGAIMPMHSEAAEAEVEKMKGDGELFEGRA
jgi:hypothetical protein